MNEREKQDVQNLLKKVDEGRAALLVLGSVLWTAGYEDAGYAAHDLANRAQVVVDRTTEILKEVPA